MSYASTVKLPFTRPEAICLKIPHDLCSTEMKLWRHL